jgi:uncharacterized protein
MITDCHVHIQPYERFLSPALLDRMRRRYEQKFEQLLAFSRSPKLFLEHLDSIGVTRAVLVNALPPGEALPSNINLCAAEYAGYDSSRLISCAYLDPRSDNLDAQIAEVLRLRMRLIKLHPPHQHFYPNDYLNGLRGLELLYRAAETNGIPVMFHTGTSVFRGARNKYADPLHIDDVAVDFPSLKIIMAHGGRPLWMETAFFLLRRHPNVYLDISSIPPRSLMRYFPRLEQIARKTAFGSDWPGPGVSSIKADLDDFRALPLSETAKQQIMADTALRIWPNE